MVTLEVGGQQDTCRLQLTDDWLVLMKEEVAYTYSPIDKIDPVLLTKVINLNQLKGLLNIKTFHVISHKLTFIVTFIHPHRQNSSVLFKSKFILVTLIHLIKSRRIHFN